MILKDKDGSGYLAYDAWGNSHTVVIERLSSNYYDTNGGANSTGKLSPSSHEAPIMFERKGVGTISCPNLNPCTIDANHTLSLVIPYSLC